MLENKPRKRSKKPSSAQHKAWQFMRRNRVFRCGDVMMVVDIKENNFRYFVKNLESGGYIKKMNKEKTFKNKTYILLKDTGLYSPTLTKHKIWDRNIQGSNNG
ncbi:hypothetical protein BN3087_220021 [Sulfurovum sp. enrichment culture clone C5]|uniref:Uncharacterized protein n=1 Tax=Sulfurovum sp. enrichment culture clone C5 TaxID=497650 RepID=A0A0S4XLL1_9BACT|nr:hypothetical protein BN3087_220021 [Sulfurovum sp. enrichment culture clone C5]